MFKRSGSINIVSKQAVAQTKKLYKQQPIKAQTLSCRVTCFEDKKNYFINNHTSRHSIRPDIEIMDRP